MRLRRPYYLCSALILLASASCSNEHDREQATKSPESSDGWTLASTSDPLDGNTYIAKKDFDKEASNSRITAVIKCASKYNLTSITLESYQLTPIIDNTLTASPFVTKTGEASDLIGMGSHYKQFVDGRISFAGKEANPLSKFFEIDHYENVISYSLKYEPDFSDIGGEDLTAVLGDSPAIKWVTSGEYIRGNLPIYIEALNTGGAQKLEIPAGNPTINQVLNQCNRPRNNGERNPLIVWGIEKMGYSPIYAEGTLAHGPNLRRLLSYSTTIKGKLTNTTDTPQTSVGLEFEIKARDGTVIETRILRASETPLPPHSTAVFSIKVENIPVDNSGGHDEAMSVNFKGLANTEISNGGEDSATNQAQRQPSDPPNADSQRSLTTAQESHEAIPPSGSHPNSEIAHVASSRKASPSFDCNSAQTPTEQMICASEELSALDAALQSSYKAYRDSLTADQAIARQSAPLAQRRWLAERDKCGDEECLKNSYVTRITSLRNQTQTNAALPR